MNYKKLPEQINVVEKNNVIKIILLFMFIIFITFIVVITCFNNNKCIVKNCNESYWEAYNTGMYDVSVAALTDGVIPVFKIENGKVVFDKEIRVEVIE